MKIKYIELSSFRGIRNPLPLQLSAENSVLLFGENGSGKSSITDAIEWFYSDKVKHLVSDEIKLADALLNIVDAGNTAQVKLHFSNDALDSTKALSVVKQKPTTKHSNQAASFGEYLEQSKKENLTLRYGDLLRFILSTKKDKLKYFSDIIGFGEVSRVRSALFSIKGSLDREIKNKGFDSRKSSEQSKLLDHLGRNVTNDIQFLEAINELIKPLNLNMDVKDNNDLLSTIKTIESKEDKESIEIDISYNKVLDFLKTLPNRQTTIRDVYKTFTLTYQTLYQNVEDIVKIQLERLLTEGLSIVKSDAFQENRCPLCLQEINQITLMNDIQRRITELINVKKLKENLEENKRGVLKELQTLLSDIQQIEREKAILLDENVAALEAMRKLRASLKKTSDLIAGLKFTTQKADFPTEITLYEDAAIKSLTDNISKHKAVNQSRMSQNKGGPILVKLQMAKAAYNAIKTLKKEEETFRRQQRSLETIYKELVKKQKESIQAFFDTMSKEINELYLFMNPDENIDEIVLVPTVREDEFTGITIQYRYHNNVVSPPNMYLSESHLNCLGLSLFLTSIKAFNKLNHFFVLDDVISSFDKNHRARFARLLLEKFKDYQIFLFTHEHEWFEQVSSMIKGLTKWKIHEIKYNLEAGAHIELPLLSVNAMIDAQLQTGNTKGLGNEIRIYMERQLKDICEQLKVKLPFIQGAQNDKRMAGELLSALEATVNKHYKIDPLIFSRIRQSSFFGNISSHDNPDNIHINEHKLFKDDLDALINIFICNKCGKIISPINCNKEERYIHCKCGNKRLMQK